MAKRKQGSLIHFGFTKKLCSDDVNSTTNSPVASPVISTPPPGVTTKGEAEEIMSSLAEDDPYPSRSSLSR